MSTTTLANRPARNAAITRQNEQIESNIAKIEEAKRRPPSALEAIAHRLQISPANLKNTLMATVFSACRNDSEFAALIVVANTYGLNPLLKELYAFPAKGGGIVPMVSVDGWIKMINTHPQFDGIEFDYHTDENGDTIAIEAVIHRKDRTRPIRVMEYMDECRGETIPWKKSPRRMLRHRALIQGGRVAFGFSGIVAEGDEVIEGDYTTPAQTLPALPKQTISEALDDEIPAFDKETGEVFDRDSRGFTEVDEDTARELDAVAEGDIDDPQDGPATEQRGEANTDAVPMWQVAANTALAHTASAGNLPTLDAAEKAWLNARDAVKEHDDNVVRQVDKAINDKRKALRAAK